jgi:hypothetical protein
MINSTRARLSQFRSANKPLAQMDVLALQAELLGCDVANARADLVKREPLSRSVILSAIGARFYFHKILLSQASPIILHRLFPRATPRPSLSLRFDRFR